MTIRQHKKLNEIYFKCFGSRGSQVRILVSRLLKIKELNEGLAPFLFWYRLKQSD